jgi:hypothetical protein
VIAALLGSRGAEEMSVFHAFVDGNGMNPFRLAIFPRLIAAQADVPVDAVIATVVEADLLESCVEVAVMVTVTGGVPAGVNVTPVPEATADEALKVPFAVGLTDKLTVFVKAPVPVTVGVHVEVCVDVIDDGEHTSETPVMVGEAAATAMLAVPDMFVYPTAAELALQVAVPAPEGVNTPPEVMVPPVAVQVTALL